MLVPSKAKVPANPSIELPAVVMKRLARGALAATSNDDVTPVMTGAVFRAVDGVVSAVATMIGILLSDLAYGAADPRIRHG